MNDSRLPRSSGRTRCILWDFGDTLADQDWMLTPPDRLPDWADAWTRVARGELEAAWNVGAARAEDVARGVAGRLGMPFEETLDHMQRCCRGIRFFDAAMDAVRRCALPQALVTVNPDLFTEWIVPHYRLEELFSVVVASWQERTDDKATLCLRALERFEGDFEPSDSLLIDNIEANVRAWERLGGRGYLFVDDASFAADLRSGLADLPLGARGS